MDRQTLLTQLAQALGGQSPHQARARRIPAAATTRDLHPTRGSEAILQAADAGAVKTTTSLNVTRGDGTSGPAFAFDIIGFGWDRGELGG